MHYKEDEEIYNHNVNINNGKIPEEKEEKEEEDESEKMKNVYFKEEEEEEEVSKMMMIIILVKRPNFQINNSNLFNFVTIFF